MRTHIVKTVFKKEVTEILRDKKTLFMTIILPILIYPLLIILGTMMLGSSSENLAQKTLAVSFSTDPGQVIIDRILDLKQEDGLLEIVQVDDYQKAMEDGKINTYIEIQQGKQMNYIVYVDSSNEDSIEAAGRIVSILEDYKEELVELKIQEMGLDSKEILEPIHYEKKNVAKNEEMAGYVLGMILPFLLIIGILTGAIYPAIDVMAGEKERGTLETLLTLPISNLELVMGKYLAVSLSALISALLNILSIGLSILFLILSANEMTAGLGASGIDFSRLVVPLIITLICVCLLTFVISALSMCICSVTKSFKEAQNATTPLMLVTMILSYASIIPNVELTKVTAAIPVVNVSLLIKSVLTFEYDLSLITLVLIANIAFVILSIWALSKLFKSEEVLFGDSKGFSFLEKRSNIKEGTLPTFGDGIMLYAVMVIVMIYICSYLQMKFKTVGIALTQVIIFIVPVILSLYIKTDFKKVYSLQRPKCVGLLGAILLGAGVWFINVPLLNLLVQVFHYDIEQYSQLQNEMLFTGNLLINLLVIAVLPAICEETLFRGFIFTALDKEKKPIRAIVLSGILFGLMHMDMVKLLPISLLGIAMAYTVYKTGSIAASMLIHFMNNSISVLASEPTSGMGSLLERGEEFINELGVVGIIGAIGVALVLIILGYLCLKVSDVQHPTKQMEG